MIKSISKVLISAMCVSILASCNSVVPNNVSDLNKTTISSEQFSDKNISGLVFSQISEQHATLLNSNVLGTDSTFKTSGAVSASSEPVPAISVAPMVDMASSKVAAGYMSSVSSYFPYPGYFEEYVVTDFEEAKTKGYVGTYLSTLNDVVKPIIKDWDNEARLVSTNGRITDKGTNESIKQPDYDKAKYDYTYYSPYQGQWQFIFTSTSLKEVYNITITPDETLVIRQKWGLRDLDFTNITVDSSKAIEIALKAIRDKSFELQQKDSQTSPIATMPVEDPNNKTEILYDIPQGNAASWYFYLEQEKGSLVWNINLNIYNPPQDRPAIEQLNCVDPAIFADPVKSKELTAKIEIRKITNSYINGGYVKIDAKTGEIKSFSRPSKNTYTYEEYLKPYPCAINGQAINDSSVSATNVTTATATGTTTNMIN